MTRDKIGKVITFVKWYNKGHLKKCIILFDTEFHGNPQRKGSHYHVLFINDKSEMGKWAVVIKSHQNKQLDWVQESNPGLLICPRI